MSLLSAEHRSLAQGGDCARERAGGGRRWDGSGSGRRFRQAIWPGRDPGFARAHWPAPRLNPARKNRRQIRPCRSRAAGLGHSGLARECPVMAVGAGIPRRAVVEIPKPDQIRLATGEILEHVFANLFRSAPALPARGKALQIALNPRHTPREFFDTPGARVRSLSLPGQTHPRWISGSVAFATNIGPRL